MVNYYRFATFQTTTHSKYFDKKNVISCIFCLLLLLMYLHCLVHLIHLPNKNILIYIENKKIPLANFYAFVMPHAVVTAGEALED